MRAFWATPAISEGAVEAVEHMGDAVHAHIAIGDGHKVAIKMPTTTVPELGAEVAVDVRPGGTHLFNDNGVMIPRNPVLAKG